MTNKVILCCVQIKSNEGCDFQDLLTHFFSNFGKVVKVRIFCNKVLMKSFIEFETQLDAENTIKSFNPAMFVYGKMRIFPSKKTTLLSTPENRPMNSRDDNWYQLKVGQKLLSSINPNQFLHQESKDNQNANNSLLNLIEEQFDNKSNSPGNQSSGFEPTKIPNTTASYQIYQPKESAKSLNRNFLFLEPPADERYADRNSDLIPENCGLISSNHEEKVLLLQKITCLRFTTKTIANIFGCFGNVIKVLLNRKSNFALIEFENSQQANHCLKSLDGERVFGNFMKLRVSKYSWLCFKGLIKDPNPEIEFKTELRKHHRYRTGLGIKPNPPSCFLHLTSVPDSLGTELIRELLGQYVTPIKITLLNKRGISSKMYLLEFAKKEDGFEIIAELHNFQVDEKILKLSFSQK